MVKSELPKLLNVRTAESEVAKLAHHGERTLVATRKGNS